MIEKMIEEESRKDKYIMCSDEEVVCSCGNTLFFRVFHSVPMNNVNIHTFEVRQPFYIGEFMYECLICGEEQSKSFLNKKIKATIDILSDYDTDKLQEKDYLEAIKELEEYLC